MHHEPCTFFTFSFYIFITPICVMYMYIVDSWLFDLLYHYIYIYQCLGVLLWSTKVFCSVLQLALSVVLLFTLCWHFANKYMDGWMDGTSPQPDTARPRIRASASYSMSVILPSFCWYSSRLPTKGWPGCVELGGWFCTEMVYPP